MNFFSFGFTRRFLQTFLEIPKMFSSPQWNKESKNQKWVLFAQLAIPICITIPIASSPKVHCFFKSSLISNQRTSSYTQVHDSMIFTYRPSSYTIIAVYPKNVKTFFFPFKQDKHFFSILVNINQNQLYKININIPRQCAYTVHALDSYNVPHIMPHCLICSYRM